MKKTYKVNAAPNVMAGGETHAYGAVIEVEETEAAALVKNGRLVPHAETPKTVKAPAKTAAGSEKKE